MKKSTKIVTIFAFIISIGISFCAGSCLNEYVNSQNRKQGCNNLISFAMDKVNSGDLNDLDTMEALISNVYAAYLYCDDSVSSEQLHDLWNTLIFEGESYIGKEDVLIETLNSIAADNIQLTEIQLWKK